MLKNIIFILCTICLVVIACKKELDNTPPSVELLSPQEGDIINAVLDSVLIHAIIVDADMHNFRYTVTEIPTGKVLIQINPRHDHVEYIELYKKYKVVIDSSINATLNFTAEDHSGNVTTKSVSFKLTK